MDDAGLMSHSIAPANPAPAKDWNSRPRAVSESHGTRGGSWAPPAHWVPSPRAAPFVQVCGYSKSATTIPTYVSGVTLSHDSDQRLLSPLIIHPYLSCRTALWSIFMRSGLDASGLPM